MILYLHGFNSSGDSDKMNLLRKQTNIEIQSPTLPVSPKETIQYIRNIIIENKKKVMLIGTSLGGFYSLYFSKLMDIPSILINPSLSPFETLKSKIGTQINYKIKQEYNWNETYIEELKKNLR